MKRTPVESSNLVSVGYDPAAQILEVEFKSKKIYRYHKVPQQIFDGLMAADSKGAYFAAHIRNNPLYPYEQVK